MFSLICVWINGWINNRKAGDLRRHLVHYDVIEISNPKYGPGWGSCFHTLKNETTGKLIWTGMGCLLWVYIRSDNCKIYSNLIDNCIYKTCHYRSCRWFLYEICVWFRTQSSYDHCKDDCEGRHSATCFWIVKHPKFVSHSMLFNQTSTSKNVLHKDISILLSSRLRALTAYIHARTNSFKVNDCISPN